MYNEPIQFNNPETPKIKTIEAIEDLYQMFINQDEDKKDEDEEVVKTNVDIISNNLDILDTENSIYDKITLIEELKLINKLQEIFKNNTNILSSLSEIFFKINSIVKRKINSLEFNIFNLNEEECEVLLNTIKLYITNIHYFGDYKNILKSFERNKYILESCEFEDSNLYKEIDNLIKNDPEIELAYSLLINNEVNEKLTDIKEESPEIKSSKEVNERYDFMHELLLKEKGLKAILEKYGLNVENTLKSWSSHIDSGPNIYENIRTIQNIEAVHPGISKFLCKEFGIVNFERYSEKILINQFEKKEDSEKPYGIILNSISDWNGAFSKMSKVYGSLYEQTKETHELRVCEKGSKMDILRHLINLKNKYEKMSYVFLGGHGDSKTIGLGHRGEEKFNLLSIDDFLGAMSKRYNEFFKENISVILASCSTGAKDGIGQKMSETMKGLKIIGPKTSSTVEDIKVIIDNDGNINFEVEFHKKLNNLEEDITSVYQKK